MRKIKILNKTKRIIPVMYDENLERMFKAEKRLLFESIDNCFKSTHPFMIPEGLKDSVARYIRKEIEFVKMFPRIEAGVKNFYGAEVIKYK